jgi:hypothetical protein
MNYKNYLGYKVYENGDVVNLKGVKLKPQFNNGYSFYEIKNKRISSSKIVLMAFEIYPKDFKAKAIRKDNNINNNSLSNLYWK